MNLSLVERETIILFNEKEPTAEVYTHNKKLQAKLTRLAQEQPLKVHKTDEYNYTVPKRCVSVRPPFTETRRAAARAYAKSVGTLPPHLKKREEC